LFVCVFDTKRETEAQGEGERKGGDGERTWARHKERCASQKTDEKVLSSHAKDREWRTLKRRYKKVSHAHDAGRNNLYDQGGKTFLRFWGETVG